VTETGNEARLVLVGVVAATFYVVCEGMGEGVGWGIGRQGEGEWDGA